MKLGIFSFNTEYSTPTAELAVACEERGFESLWLPEHTHIPAVRETEWPAGGRLPKEYIHMADPFTSLAAAAMVTEKILLGTGISLIVEHDPLVQAKQIATLDRISKGRSLFFVSTFRKGNDWCATVIWALSERRCVFPLRAPK